MKDNLLRMYSFKVMHMTGQEVEIELTAANAYTSLSLTKKLDICIEYFQNRECLTKGFDNYTCIYNQHEVFYFKCKSPSM